MRCDDPSCASGVAGRCPSVRHGGDQPGIPDPPAGNAPAAFDSAPTRAERRCWPWPSGAEHAAVALRRAVTTGQDHDAAAAELGLAAATALATPPHATRTETHPALNRPQRSQT